MEGPVMTSDRFRIAAVQASPIFLNRDATTEKACGLIAEAAKGGATLVVFPEAFIPCYPVWSWLIPPAKTQELRDLYTRFHEHSITIPGPAAARLAQAAGDCRVTVAIGVSEKNAEGSDSTLYNTILYLGADGKILGKHRKMIPTAAERLVWGPAADFDLEVFDLPFGRLGGLICWENYMPLARYALAAEGIQIHVAPTWDRGEPWISTVRHIAKESRCVVVGVCQALRKEHIADTLDFKREYLGDAGDWLNPGLSLIVDPDGKVVAGPLEKEEGILYADIDSAQLVGPRWQLDIAGHYARPDLFELQVRRERRPLRATTRPKMGF
jgi:nitrilase